MHTIQDYIIYCYYRLFLQYCTDFFIITQYNMVSRIDISSCFIYTTRIILINYRLSHLLKMLPYFMTALFFLLFSVLYVCCTELCLIRSTALLMLCQVLHTVLQLLLSVAGAALLRGAGQIQRATDAVPGVALCVAVVALCCRCCTAAWGWSSPACYWRCARCSHACSWRGQSSTPSQLPGTAWVGQCQRYFLHHFTLFRLHINRCSSQCSDGVAV